LIQQGIQVEEGEVESRTPGVPTMSALQAWIEPPRRSATSPTRSPIGSGGWTTTPTHPPNWPNWVRTSGKSGTRTTMNAGRSKVQRGPRRPPQHHQRPWRRLREV